MVCRGVQVIGWHPPECWDEEDLDDTTVDSPQQSHLAAEIAMVGWYLSDRWELVRHRLRIEVIHSSRSTSDLKICINTFIK